MSSDAPAIVVEGISKRYEVFAQPKDRLKQMVVPRLSRLFGFSNKQYYKEFWAVKDVSFTVRRGETVGIIGRNGSGKSTLLQMICGTVNPTLGRVTVNGRIAALLELGAGFNVEFTGRENVLLNAAILGFPQEAMRDQMDKVVAFSELGEFIDQPVKTYSSGMYARLAFSIAIHVEPDILIIDEALAVGDSRFVAKCMRRIKDIQQQGTTILFVSHDVSSVRLLCDRAVWLDRGMLVADGDVFPVTGQYMEFMFSDEVEHSDQKTENACDDIAREFSHDNRGVTSAVDLDSRPVTHWGSHLGLILSACVCDKDGRKRDLFEWGQWLEVKLVVDLPKELQEKKVTVAFSIKDLKGTDLIVSTTQDFSPLELHSGHSEIIFKLKNPLVPGKYLLVAAVENREYADSHYYEYLEGAHYFSVSCEERLFGIFQPDILKSIKG